MKIHLKIRLVEAAKIFVKGGLDELGISSIHVQLDEIETNDDVSDGEKKNMNSQIAFKALKDKRRITIQKI